MAKAPADQEPRFSVITPAFEAEDTILRCLESVQQQTTANYEHIVIDDGSTDRTRELVARYAEEDPRIRLIPAQHGGVAEARNTGMACARGELLARLDADDQFLPSYLEDVDRVFSSHPDADIVSTNGYQVFADGSKVFYYKDPLLQTESSLTLKDMLRGHMFGTSAVINKHVFEMTGGARPETYSEDPDLWLRAVALGAKHYHLPKPVFLYYQDQDPAKRITGNTRAIWGSHKEILAHLIDSGNLDDEEVRLAIKALRKLRVKLAIHWEKWGLPLHLRMRR